MDTRQRIAAGTAVAGVAMLCALAAAGLRQPTPPPPATPVAAPAIETPPVAVVAPLPRPKPVAPPEKTRKSATKPSPEWCAQVRWALANLDPDTLAAHIRRATPAELEAGQQCVRRKS